MHDSGDSEGQKQAFVDDCGIAPMCWASATLLISISPFMQIKDCQDLRVALSNGIPGS